MLENDHIKPVNDPKKYKGIGGWLIFVIISLILTPLLSLIYIVESLIPMLDSYAWTVLNATNSNPLLKPLLYFEMVVNILLIIVPLILLVMMFKKSKKFPKVMIIYLISALVVNLVDVALAMYVFSDLGVGDQVKEEIYRSLAQTLIFTGVWIPYFMRSERVKATFLDK